MLTLADHMEYKTYCGFSQKISEWIFKFWFTVVQESDVIMSFANHGPTDLSYVQTFWFNMKEFPSSLEEEIMSAELRIFRGESNQKGSFNAKLIQLHGQGRHDENDQLDVVTFSESDKGWYCLNLK